MGYFGMTNFMTKNWFEPVFFQSINQSRPVLNGPVLVPQYLGSVWTGCGCWLPHLGIKNQTELDLWTLPKNNLNVQVGAARSDHQKNYLRGWHIWQVPRLWSPHLMCVKMWLNLPIFAWRWSKSQMISQQPLLSIADFLLENKVDWSRCWWLGRSVESNVEECFWVGGGRNVWICEGDDESQELWAQQICQIFTLLCDVPWVEWRDV